MRYPDDLNTEDVIDIFISKGLLTGEDIEDFIINENEDFIQKRELENIKLEEERKEESIRLAKQTEEKWEIKEKELKEIYPNANIIISNYNKAELFIKTSWLWWIAGLFFDIGLGMSLKLCWIYYALLIIQFTYGMNIRPGDSRVELAKESLQYYLKNHQLDGGKD